MGRTTFACRWRRVGAAALATAATLATTLKSHPPVRCPNFTTFSFGLPSPVVADRLGPSKAAGGHAAGELRGRGRLWNEKAPTRQGQDPVDWLRAAVLTATVCVGLLGSPSGLPGQPEPAWARRSSTTASGQRVNKDPVSLLQLALPIENLRGEKQVEVVRELQADIEEAKANTLLRLYTTAQSFSGDAANVVNKRREALLKPVPAASRPEAAAITDKIQEELSVLSQAILTGLDSAAGTVKDAEAASAALTSAEKCQQLVGGLEELMVGADYKAPVPADVPANLPQLQGRATVEFKLRRSPNWDGKRYTIDAKLYDEATMRVVADGWSAPITAGNFVDLVDRGFYNGMKIQRADGFIIQTGDTGDAEGHGFRPSPGGKVRTIPLEVAVAGKTQALYGETLDEARLVGAQVKIPFQADGTLSMARAEFDNDSASSQFFIFLFESDLTPAGKNFLDGRYGSFGYTIEGAPFWRQVAEGDIVTSAKVISGIDNLKRS